MDSFGIPVVLEGRWGRFGGSGGCGRAWGVVRLSGGVTGHGMAERGVSMVVGSCTILIRVDGRRAEQYIESELRDVQAYIICLPLVRH